MAEQASRRLAGTATYNLLVAAAASNGSLVSTRDDTLFVFFRGNVIKLAWPPARTIRKTHVPNLLTFSRTLSAVPTIRFARQISPPFLPAIAKPDLGRAGAEQRIIRTDAAWKKARLELSRRFVVQPLLRGPEYRVTVCRSKTFAAARLRARRGNKALWDDASSDVPVSWLKELHRLVTHLDAPGAGFDIIVSSGRPFLLDVNVDPSLAIHLTTAQPRDLAPDFLEDWTQLRRGRGNMVTPR